MGMFFFPQHEIKRSQAKKMFEIIVEKEGTGVPGLERGTGSIRRFSDSKAKECMPCIMQGFIKQAGRG